MTSTNDTPSQHLHHVPLTSTDPISKNQKGSLFMDKKWILLLAFLSVSLFCNADHIEYQIIPLSEAGDHFDLSQNRPMKTNSKGQKIEFRTESYGFYDPCTDQFIRLPYRPLFITENGLVAGEQYNKGFVWSFESGNIDFFEINARCDVKAINDHGDVLFNSVFRKSYDHARIYTANKEIIEIPSLALCARGTAMNDFLQVVGGTGEYLGWLSVRAFIWDQNNGMRYLSDLIPQDSGWYLRMATYINNEGLIIGEGRYNGIPCEFLLIPSH